MHPSRMRTVRHSSRPLGGVPAPRGVPAPVGGLLWERGGIPACTEADPPPPVDRQTGVKTFLFLWLISAELAGAVCISSEAITKGGCILFKYCIMVLWKEWTLFQHNLCNLVVYGNMYLTYE